MRYYFTMKLMKLFGSFVFFVFVLSCQTGPEPVAPQVQEPLPLPPPVEPLVTYVPELVEEDFAPVEVSQELYQTTIADIQALVGQLNGIIRARNYNSWRGYLADDYYRRISSAEFLEERTDELFRRDQIVASATGRTAQRRVLRTTRDYFEHIVVPSRSNDRVDDIAFLSDNQVRAYTIDNRGNILILYDLELIDGNWRIVN